MIFLCPITAWRPFFAPDLGTEAYRQNGDVVGGVERCRSDLESAADGASETISENLEG
jgi:hypothetical protein